MSTLSLPIGQLVGKTLGNYHLKYQMGYGRLSALYLAEEQIQKRTAMLTVLIIPEDCEGEPRERFITRFTQEAAALVRLKHPSIIPIDDFGVQFGYPYLITPFVEERSLAKDLKQQIHYTPVRTLEILRQIAEGLDYVHSNGIVHGMLKPANILLGSQQTVHITGFGLHRILAMQGIKVVNHPEPHLLSIANTFLGSPEYIAPEIVEGAPVDARSDVYSLGVMLFELLTGTLPFTGTNPFAVAAQHLYQQVPPLQAVRPDAPAGLDLIIQRALDRDPGQRFQSAGKLATAFARVLKVIEVVWETTEPPHSTATAATHITPVQPLVLLPGTEAGNSPNSNWFEAEVAANGKWHLMSLEATGYVPVIPVDTPTHKPAISPISPSLASEESGSWQISPPIITREMRAISSNATGSLQLPNAPISLLPNSSGRSDVAAVETSKQLASRPVSEKQAQAPADPGKTTQITGNEKPVRAAETKRDTKPRVAAVKTPKTSKKSNTPSKGRRKVVILAASSVATVGILGAGGVGLAHFMPNILPSLSNLQKMIKQALPHNTVPQKKPAPQSSVTPQSSATPQSTMGQTQNTPQATAVTKPTQPAHAGTGIGSTGQAVNSAKSFSNPADGKVDKIVIGWIKLS